VFISSRIYGGYAQNPPTPPSLPTPPERTVGCLNPEPYSYEEGFAVQRLIVAQIKQEANISNNDDYSGDVHYSTNKVPWFDWGPYLWASGDQPREDGLVWCNNNPPPSQCSGIRDLRYGDPNDQVHYWGDFTHPSADGAKKVADKFVNFIQASPLITSWKGK